MEIVVRSNFAIQFTHEGLTLSVGVGPGHYCDHHNLSSVDVLYTKLSDFDTDEQGRRPTVVPPKTPPATTTGEFAIVLPSGLVRLQGDDEDWGETVAGYIDLTALPGLLQILIQPFDTADRIELMRHRLREHMEERE